MQERLVVTFPQPAALHGKEVDPERCLLLTVSRQPLGQNISVVGSGEGALSLVSTARAELMPHAYMLPEVRW